MAEEAAVGPSSRGPNRRVIYSRFSSRSEDGDDDATADDDDESAALSHRQKGRIARKKSIRAALNREAIEVRFLAQLSFLPKPQRWVRDPARAGAEANDDVVDPDLVSHVLLLQHPDAWVQAHRREAQTLYNALLRQFVLAGLRVCRLEPPDLKAQQHEHFFGMYAVNAALVEEKRNMMSASILSWNGESTSEIPTALTVSPAEKMLLTTRIIHRCIEFVRDKREEKFGFVGPPGLGKKLAMWFGAACCPDMDCMKLRNVEVRYMVKDIFGLHCKRVRSNLVRLFSKEVRMFCCRSCKRRHFTDDGKEEFTPELQTSNNRLRLAVDIPPFMDFLDELRYHYGSETAVFFAFSSFCFRQLVWLSLSAAAVAFVTIGIDDAHLSVLIRGLYGLFVLLGWAPVFTRLWQRTYRILRVRWTLDAEAARFGLLDSSNQKVRWTYCRLLNSLVAALTRSFFGVFLLLATVVIRCYLANGSQCKKFLRTRTRTSQRSSGSAF